MKHRIFKKFIVVSSMDKKTAGKVVGFTSKYDNDSGVPTIDIASDKFNACVSIGENEILSIE